MLEVTSKQSEIFLANIPNAFFNNLILQEYFILQIGSLRGQFLISFLATRLAMAKSMKQK